MMESELLQPNWAIYNTNSSFDHSGFYGFPVDDPCDFSSSFLSADSSSAISFDSYFPDSLVEFPSFCDEKQVIDTIADMWVEESDSVGNISSQLTSESAPWTPQSHTPAVLPAQEMDSQQIWLNHLLTAYGEAVQNGHRELSEVVAGRIGEKINPLGEPRERVAFNLFQSQDSHGNYLRQQSSRNWEEAFRTFYQWYPYGRFAHFTANSSILQVMPGGVDTVHIVDFDMGEGIQWPPLIEAMSRVSKAALRITSVKFSGEDSVGTEFSGQDSGGKALTDSMWSFEDTKRRLCHHASSLGINLKIEEMELEDLISEINGTTRRDWLAFNLMFSLPHMGRQRERTHVDEFLRVAKALLPYSNGDRGIITFGDGAGDYPTACPGYSYFFNNRFKQFEALFESMESDFPDYLPEARIAMESLFVSPYVSSHSWFLQWQGTKEGKPTSGLEGRRMSRESLMEARQIVNQRESCYQVFIPEGVENEIVLQWKGTPLIRISCWR